ncbi:enoyl-CoA hydratase/isomerase family protein [Chloroflexota bacterium]
MPYTTIIYTKQDHIARITLNRPQANNIINRQLAQELKVICHAINQDDDIHVVVATGAGNGAFCGGSDLEHGSAEYNVATAIASIDRPVIAVINGDALGQGLELALSCDIRLTSHQARFGFPQVSQELIPMDGGTQTLPRIIGRSTALGVLLTGRWVRAEEALRLKLVNHVMPGDELLPTTERLAKRIGDYDPVAVSFAKQAITRGLDMSLDEGLKLEARLGACISSS